MSLTPEQIQFFRHNGFLKLPERLPETTVALLRDAIWSDIRGEVEPVVRDRQGRVVRISNLWGRDPIFRETVAGPAVLDPLASLLGPNFELILNRHNHATLRLGEEGSNYLHRDVLQWSRPILTVIYYLEETTVENGCTQLIPGTHLLPGFSTINVAEDEQVQRGRLLEQVVPVPMPAGGMLAIDSLVIHGAGANRTRGTRMSMTVGYHSVDELTDAPNPKRVLVRGNRPYLGNDAKAR